MTKRMRTGAREATRVTEILTITGCSSGLTSGHNEAESLLPPEDMESGVRGLVDAWRPKHRLLCLGRSPEQESTDTYESSRPTVVLIRLEEDTWSRACSS